MIFIHKSFQNRIPNNTVIVGEYLLSKSCWASTKKRSGIVPVYTLIQEVRFLVLLWVWVLSLNHQSIYSFDLFFRVCEFILYLFFGTNHCVLNCHIIAIPESIVLIDESICVLLLDYCWNQIKSNQIKWNQTELDW